MAAVSYTHVASTKLRAWAAVASRIGWKDDYAAALREMEEQLTTDAETWGEPVKEYRALHLTLYHRYGRVLTVKYAVHIAGTPVFVLNVFLTPGTPLHEAAD